MTNIHIKRIIVAIASVSLLLTTALFSGCNDGKNYEEEIANLQAQIDELKKDHEQFAAEHKEIMDKLEGGQTYGTTDEDETGSTTITTTTTTTTKSKNNNGTTAKPATTTTTTKSTTTTTKKPDDDGFGTEVGM